MVCEIVSKWVIELGTELKSIFVNLLLSVFFPGGAPRIQSMAQGKQNKRWDKSVRFLQTIYLAYSLESLKVIPDDKESFGT